VSFRSIRSNRSFLSILIPEPFKNTRIAWTKYFCIFTSLLLVAFFLMLLLMLSDHITYKSEQVFVSFDYENRILFTNVDSFELPKSKGQEIAIYKMLDEVDSGEKVLLIISEVDGELLEIEYSNKTVYKKELVPIYGYILVLTFLAVCIALLVVSLIAVNAKNPVPGGKLDKLAKNIFKSFYKSTKHNKYI